MRHTFSSLLTLVLIISVALGLPLHQLCFGIVPLLIILIAISHMTGGKSASQQLTSFTIGLLLTGVIWASLVLPLRASAISLLQPYLMPFVILVLVLAIGAAIVLMTTRAKHEPSLGKPTLRRRQEIVEPTRLPTLLPVHEPDQESESRSHDDLGLFS